MLQTRQINRYKHRKIDTQIQAQIDRYQIQAQKNRQINRYKVKHRQINIKNIERYVRTSINKYKNRFKHRQVDIERHINRQVDKQIDR